MPLTKDTSLDYLKEIIDKYEHPELFSLLDDNQLQLDLKKKIYNTSFDVNSVVIDTETQEKGIVLEAKPDKIVVKFSEIKKEYKDGEIKKLVSDSSRTLPLDWAKKRLVNDFKRFYLKSLSYFLYLTHRYDKMQSLSNSRTQLLAHQIESTYIVTNSVSPRFLLADEVGLGKTIEAGLILKEFSLKFGYDKIAIIVPASLQLQWQKEMEEKFNENFVVIDSRTLKKAKVLPDKIILSVDFAKQERVEKILLKKRWDVIVFDEAHRLRRDTRTTTKAYNMAERLSKIPKVLLLLSATPFSGKLEELYYLIRLLNPTLLGAPNHFVKDYVIDKKEDLHDKISSVLIRRRKVDIGGFTKRFAKTISFEFSPDEKLLYDKTTEYIKTGYDKALREKNRMTYFIMIVYQKMLDSSSYTLLKTISKRLIFLEKVLDSRTLLEAEFKKNNKKLIAELQSELSEEEVEDIDELLIDSINAAEQELEIELMQLREIQSIAKGIKENKKGEALKKIIDKILSENPKEKILIFTQFRRTQEYLKDLLGEYKISLFHGGLNKVEKDKMIYDFEHEKNILISTEAGGEGRNLQFCRYLFNYDLPWSPLKIEQRIGRLHRFGQKHNVRIFNFSTKGTIGAKILDVLSTKIKVFEDAIGETDTLLGYYEDEIDFNSTFMNFYFNEKKAKSELNQKLVKAKENFKYLEKLTAHKVVDFNLDAFYAITKKERNLTNNLIKNMVKNYCLLSESFYELSNRKNIHILSAKKTGKVFEGFFSSKDSLKYNEYDFFAFGHKVIDFISEKTREKLFLGLMSKIAMRMPLGVEEKEGVLFNFLVTFKSHRIYQQFIPVFVDKERLNDFEESEKISSEFLKFKFSNGQKENIDIDTSQLPSYFNKSLMFLEFKIKILTDEIKEKLQLQLGKEIPSINKYYNRIVKELENLLELQKSKEKIYNVSTLKGLITRTENKIKMFKKKQEQEMARIGEAQTIKSYYELVNLSLVKLRAK